MNEKNIGIASSSSSLIKLHYALYLEILLSPTQITLAAATNFVFLPPLPPRSRSKESQDPTA